ncbi:hypothetical protein CONCODRAFT_14300 [Conidiobolus coronatus NRRL 28638]|uniref:Transcription factor domain-containing protein n=1 Tax=Conidiobolus coronatus (strain ATCC 28846 / CBS 209.66 / NRRL 28638) TaxID=796925 RepID=A0A137NP91_CONC2|nr:hypothetical protein CONCODRAFT_14300 [Conidiobolus coronatus NRRL 28638]|eukprot:KXN64557.1 hypothetical protein CONCODRAFT_14300 [Conidiobolus coronatus NRRL 28638]
MESKKHKSISGKSPNIAKSYQYSKNNFYQIKEDDLDDVYNRLELFEKTLTKAIKSSDDNISERHCNNNKETMKYRKMTINQRILKIFKYDDFPKRLISFYFTYQYFFTTPSVFSIKEYYKCMVRFNGEIPEYLTCAIMSKSSLYYPCSQLYRINLGYSNYYYELSVKYLNISMSRNEIDIYMLYALSILSWIDKSLNRQFFRFSRVSTSTKLVQVLGLTSSYFNPNSENINLSQSSLKKLLGFLMADNKEISKVFNIPKINLCKKLELDCYQMRNEENDKTLIDRSINLLPKEYKFTFKAAEYYLNLKFTHINALEKNLNSKSAAYCFEECYKLIRYINEKYCGLPRTVRYSKNCLNIEEIEKSPLLIRILRLYQLVLRQITEIYGLMVRIIHKCSTYQIILLSQNISIFFERVLDLLKDQHFFILKSSKNDIYLDSPHFFYFGSLLLDLMENLNRELDNRKCLNLKVYLETTLTGFNSFTTLITHFQSDWEGSDKILKSLTERYEPIRLIK